MGTVEDCASSKCTEIYAIYVPGTSIESVNFNDFVFEKKIDCLVQLKKYRGARFKTFYNHQDALSFTIYGPSTIHRVQSGATASREEKPSPFPTLTPQQHIMFRKTIEKGDKKLFNDFLEFNPRHLVSKADTPAILKEGPRYNAMHIACIHNKPEFCAQILEIVSSEELFKKIYPDDISVWAKRRASHLLDLYLNTPDKGFNRTPLHYASAFGFIECIKILVSYPNCAKNAVDKYNNNAVQLICSRSTKVATENLRSDIEILLGDHYYVPIFHDEENLFSAKIAEPMSPTVSTFCSPSPPRFDNQLNNSIGRSFSPSYKLYGYAGPMSPQQAKGFYTKWRAPMTSSPKTPMNSRCEVITAEANLEKIGRELAFDMKLPWKEYWEFLGEYVNITSPDGLTKLESHLKKKLNQVLVEKNNLEDSNFVSNGLNDNSSTTIFGSHDSSMSTIGALCVDFDYLRLNSINSDKKEFTPMKAICQTLEETQSHKEAINNNSIPCDLEDDTFDFMRYIKKSMEVTSNNISRIFVTNCTKVFQLKYSKLYNLRREVCIELKNLRNVLGRLIVEREIDLSFVHIDLAFKIVQNMYKKWEKINFNSVLHSFNGMGDASDDEVVDDNIFSHFKCLSLFMTEIGVTYNKDFPYMPPPNMCLCPWITQQKDELKYKNAHSFMKLLSNWEKQTPTENSVVRQLTFSDDDKESFVTALSSIGDSMATPKESFSFFIHGSYPTAIDNVVHSAICKIEIDLELYPFIGQWCDIVSSYTMEQRKRWPSLPANQKEIPNTSSSTQNRDRVTSTPKLLRNSFYAHFDKTL